MPKSRGPGVLRRLAALHLHARKLRHERELAECARELSGAASWSIDADAGVYSCSSEIAGQLDPQGAWPRERWPELLDHMPTEAREELSRTCCSFTFAAFAVARTGTRRPG